jgi:hypothetical protein
MWVTSSIGYPKDGHQQPQNQSGGKNQKLRFKIDYRCKTRSRSEYTVPKDNGEGFTTNS